MHKTQKIIFCQKSLASICGISGKRNSDEIADHLGQLPIYLLQNDCLLLLRRFKLMF